MRKACIVLPTALLCVPSHSWRDLEEFSGAHKIVQAIHDIGRLRRIAKGEDFQRTWRSKRAGRYPSIAAHVEGLKIPTSDQFGNWPSLVIYELGSFKDNITQRNRIDNIFHSKHTCVAVPLLLKALSDL